MERIIGSRTSLWEAGTFRSFLKPPSSHSLRVTASPVPGADAAATPSRGQQQESRLSGRSQSNPVCKWARGLALEAGRRAQRTFQATSKRARDFIDWPRRASETQEIALHLIGWVECIYECVGFFFSSLSIFIPLLKPGESLSPRFPSPARGPNAWRLECLGLWNLQFPVLPPCGRHWSHLA